MLPKPANIFDGADAPASVEEFLTLLETSAARVERIASHGQASPEGFWYDQDDDEWVLLLRGTATLRFEEGSVNLGTGDHLHISRHVRHRVENTSPDAVWLAVHLKHSAAMETG